MEEILNCDHSNESYFLLHCWFITLCKVALTYEYVDDVQMKASEQYFPVVLFNMLYKVVQTFDSVDEILKCDHSNESY